MKSNPSLRSGLISHQLEGQLMVYDKIDDQIHLLDGTTASVFALLEQGATPEVIESKLSAQQSVAPGAELLALALDQLARARLLEGEATRSGPVMEDRRQALQKLVGVGAALLIPAIVTLAPSRAYAATLLGSGATCSASNQCASGCCGANNSNGNHFKCTTNPLDTCLVP